MATNKQLKKQLKKAKKVLKTVDARITKIVIEEDKIVIDFKVNAPIWGETSKRIEDLMNN